MFGKKYKIIQELKDKKVNSSLDEIDLEEAEYENKIESNNENNRSKNRE